MKSLAPGDRALAGIEPHGTRIRLKVRASVDLSKLDILSILRYWILLPACPVFYQEFGQQNLEVVFDDVKSALHYLSTKARGDLKELDTKEDDSNNLSSREPY